MRETEWLPDPLAEREAREAGIKVPDPDWTAATLKAVKELGRAPTVDKIARKLGLTRPEGTKQGELDAFREALTYLAHLGILVPYPGRPGTYTLKERVREGGGR